MLTEICVPSTYTQVRTSWVDVNFLNNVSLWPENFAIAFNALHNFRCFPFTSEVCSLCKAPPVEIKRVTGEEKLAKLASQVMKICFGGTDFGVRIRSTSEWVFGPSAIEYTWIVR